MKATFLAGASALALLIPSLAWAGEGHHSSPGLEVEVNGNQLAGDNAANHGSVAGVDAYADNESIAADAGRNVAWGGAAIADVGGGKGAAGSQNAIDSFNVHQVNHTHLSAANAANTISNIAGASIGGDSVGGNAAAGAAAFNGALAAGGDSATGQVGAAGGNGGPGSAGQANVAGNTALAGDLGLGGGGDETEAEAESGQGGNAQGPGGAGGPATATNTGAAGGEGKALAASGQKTQAWGGAGGPGGNGGDVRAEMYTGVIDSMSISGTNGLVGALASTGFNVNQLQSISINAHSSF